MLIYNNYITILGWMRTDLKLKSNELIVYAMIYGFCQAKEETKLSISYITSWTGVKKRATINIIAKLEKKGLIKVTKTDGKISGYTILRGEDFAPVQKMHQCRKVHRTSAKNAPVEQKQKERSKEKEKNLCINQHISNSNNPKENNKESEELRKFLLEDWTYHDDI